MVQKNPMTSEGFQVLKEKLKYLKTTGRREISDALKEALAHGDLKENHEYKATKEQQFFMEKSITEIEYKLANSQVIDPSKLMNMGKVIFGSTTHLTNIKTQEKLIYQIVGIDESSVENGKISFQSPVAKVLIGKQIGDCVEVHTPLGTNSFEITKIECI